MLGPLCIIVPDHLFSPEVHGDDLPKVCSTTIKIRHSSMFLIVIIGNLTAYNVPGELHIVLFRRAAFYAFPWCNSIQQSNTFPEMCQSPSTKQLYHFNSTGCNHHNCLQVKLIPLSMYLTIQGETV